MALTRRVVHGVVRAGLSPRLVGTPESVPGTWRAALRPVSRRWAILPRRSNQKGAPSLTAAMVISQPSTALSQPIMPSGAVRQPMGRVAKCCRRQWARRPRRRPMRRGRRATRRCALMISPHWFRWIWCFPTSGSRSAGTRSSTSPTSRHRRHRRHQPGAVGGGDDQRRRPPAQDAKHHAALHRHHHPVPATQRPRRCRPTSARSSFSTAERVVHRQRDQHYVYREGQGRASSATRPRWGCSSRWWDSGCW